MSASVSRALLYGGARLGLYPAVRRAIQGGQEPSTSATASVARNAAAGMVSGALAAGLVSRPPTLWGQPFSLSKACPGDATHPAPGASAGKSDGPCKDPAPAEGASL